MLFPGLRRTTRVEMRKPAYTQQGTTARASTSACGYEMVFSRGFLSSFSQDEEGRNGNLEKCVNAFFESTRMVRLVPIRVPGTSAPYQCSCSDC